MQFYFISLFVCAVLVRILAEDPVTQNIFIDDDDKREFQPIDDVSGDDGISLSQVMNSELGQLYGISERYDPMQHNIYYLYTRENPDIPYSIAAFDLESLSHSKFNPRRRTIILAHGWKNCFRDPFSRILPKAILEAADVNVIVVDWSIGANTRWYLTALGNCIISGPVVAEFLNWICLETGADGSLFHLIGHSLGAQKVGIIGRNMEVKPAYITACDPAQPGWQSNSDALKPDDANYTEVIHSNAGAAGCVSPLGHVDFYPNGGKMMPGCRGDVVCSHSRSYYYLAESITGGYFEGIKCRDPLCQQKINLKMQEGHLWMGGLTPKPGFRGSYYLKTNRASP